MIFAEPRNLRAWVLGVASVAGLGIAALLFWRTPAGEANARPEVPAVAEVRYVRNGSMVELDSDRKLVYAGIVAPYAGHPLHAKAKDRNTELVGGKEIRLRFDTHRQDRKGRMHAYAFIGDLFVNETLVREGLAHVRLTTSTRRFADRLLAAQAEARAKRRGLWSRRVGSSEDGYPADPKYGHFHRPTCEEVGKINPQRLVEFGQRRSAIDQGYAPCGKCSP